MTASREVIHLPSGYQLTSQSSGFAPMLAEAVGCIALGVCVLGVSGAPGGRAVRRVIAQLRAAEQLLTTNPEAAMVLIAEAREASTRGLDDLRHLVRGIYPPVLADRGLADAVRALAFDDGQGGADQAAGTGLSGVERRLAAFDGILAVTSPPGGPTIIAIEVPCLSSDDSWTGQDRTWADVVRSSWQTRTLI